MPQGDNPEEEFLVARRVSVPLPAVEQFPEKSICACTGRLTKGSRKVFSRCQCAAQACSMPQVTIVDHNKKSYLPPILRPSTHGSPMLGRRTSATSRVFPRPPAAKAGVGRRSPGHPDEVPCPFALRCPRVASRRVAQADDASGGCPTVATVLTNPVPCFCADRRRRTGRRSGTRGTGTVPRFKLLPCRGRISA